LNANIYKEVCDAFVCDGSFSAHFGAAPTTDCSGERILKIGDRVAKFDGLLFMVQLVESGIL